MNLNQWTRLGTGRVECAFTDTNAISFLFRLTGTTLNYDSANSIYFQESQQATVKCLIAQINKLSLIYVA